MAQKKSTGAKAVLQASSKPSVSLPKRSVRKAHSPQIATALASKSKGTHHASSEKKATASNRKRKVEELDASAEVDSEQPKLKKTSKSKPVQQSKNDVAGPRTVTKSRIINHAPTQILKIFSVGEASEGELGLGPDSKRAKRPQLNPHLLPGPVGVVQIATGGMHALALTRNNKIFSWGVNDTGALGRDTNWEPEMVNANDSDSDDSDSAINPLESTPTAISSEHFPANVVFTQVAAGDSTSFAVTDDGRVYGWGTFRDTEGKTGFMLDKDHKLVGMQRTPILIPSLKGITELACGADHALALDVTGRVHAWGRGEQSQLGRRVINRRKAEALIPGRVVLGRQKAIAIGCGSYHSFAIDTDGDLWAWGLNSFGESGKPVDPDDDSTHFVNAPQKVESTIGRHMKMVQGGSHHSVGMTAEGQCLVWGRADVGQCGLDLSTIPDKNVVKDVRGNIRIILHATAIPGLEVTAVAAGSDHSIAISSAGEAYSWGFNSTFQTGHGGAEEEIKIASMIKCASLKDAKMVGAGAGGQFSLLFAQADAGENDIVVNELTRRVVLPDLA